MKHTPHFSKPHTPSHRHRDQPNTRGTQALTSDHIQTETHASRQASKRIPGRCVVAATTERAHKHPQRETVPGRLPTRGRTRGGTLHHVPATKRERHGAVHRRRAAAGGPRGRALGVLPTPQAPRGGAQNVIPPSPRSLAHAAHLTPPSECSTPHGTPHPPRLASTCITPQPPPAHAPHRAARDAGRPVGRGTIFLTRGLRDCGAPNLALAPRSNPPNLRLILEAPMIPTPHM